MKSLLSRLKKCITRRSMARRNLAMLIDGLQHCYDVAELRRHYELFKLYVDDFSPRQRRIFHEAERDREFLINTHSRLRFRPDLKPDEIVGLLKCCKRLHEVDAILFHIEKNRTSYSEGYYERVIYPFSREKAKEYKTQIKE